MFQVKTCCELKLAADFDNANLLLIWSHCHFQQKNVKVSFCQKYERWSHWTPEKCYQCTVVEFVV